MATPRSIYEPIRPGDLVLTNQLYEQSDETPHRLPLYGLVVPKKQFLDLYLEQRAAIYADAAWPAGKLFDTEEQRKWGSNIPIIGRDKDGMRGRLEDLSRIADEAVFMQASDYQGVWVFGQPFCKDLDRIVEYEIVRMTDNNKPMNNDPSFSKYVCSPQNIENVAGALSLGRIHAQVGTNGSTSHINQSYDMTRAGTYLLSVTKPENDDSMMRRVRIQMDKMGFKEGQFAPLQDSFKLIPSSAK